jgi:hypothetical protein
MGAGNQNMKRFKWLGLLILTVTSLGFGQVATPMKLQDTTNQDQSQIDSAATVEPVSRLADLGWMVGEWVDRGDEATVVTRCRWINDHQFLSRNFKVNVGGETTLQGTQTIGWDPIRQQIRSWTFDSEGGFGEGWWIPDGDRWLVKASFVLATGERASALNVFTKVDQNSFRWQSIDREVGGELQPSLAEVTVVRSLASSNIPAQQSMIPCCQPVIPCCQPAMPRCQTWEVVR